MLNINTYMDDFKLNIDYKKFRSTNELWNKMMLNDPWSVGYVTTLIDKKDFKSKEEWEDYYYQSGQKRKDFIQTLDTQTQTLLNDELLIKKDRSKVDSLSSHMKAVNTNHGRTKEDLLKKAKLLYKGCKKFNINLTGEECFESVRYRVICETWNGIYLRERNTVKTLQSIFTDIEFKKVDGDIDHKYGIDYEVYKNGTLHSAIQIKPETYLGTTTYITKAKKANKFKNEKYVEEFGVNVYNVFSNNDGEIINEQILERFK